MLYRVRGYIKFLWQSKNAHGVHSPFVFDLVTNCFYNKAHATAYSRLIKNKDLDFNKAGLLFRLIKHFKPETVLIAGTCADCNSIITIAKPEAAIINDGINQGINAYPFAIIDSKEKAAALNYFEQLLPTIKNESIWIINHIHSSAEMQEAWQNIKSHPGISVTIDTFYYGLVFFRKEQAKQNFIIRTSASKMLNAFLGSRTLWGLLD